MTDSNRYPYSLLVSKLKMGEQFEELAQLKDEKHRLLAIQDQLQQLHDRFQQVTIVTVVVGSNQCYA